ncbi:MAG TPA: hypothetical protein VMR18_03655 [Candidatus Saccharimonadales bacterium]|nr:hypothetical protein [Candidatus Saccharimonadales bacterium]
MPSQVHKSFYDPLKTYDDNFENGPFSVFDDEHKSPDKGQPKFSFLGHKIYSPFGIPAGPLLNSKYIKYAFEHGFDVICYKTQRSVTFKCNDFPNVLYLDLDGDLTLEDANEPQLGKSVTSKPVKEISITNSFGNPCRGPKFWVPDLKKAISCQGDGQLLIMSVVGTIQEGFGQEDYYGDFANTAELALKSGVSAIELNLSCPNVASEGVLCYTHDAVVSICKKTKEKIGNMPLIAKLGYFSNEQTDLLGSILKDTSEFISAVASINTISAPIVDDKGQQALPGPNRLKSGVCGAGVKWAGLDMVKRLSSLRDKLGLKYEIVGVGGVMSEQDFSEYRLAGADIVQSATGAMWNPRLAAEIKEHL